MWITYIHGCVFLFHNYSFSLFTRFLKNVLLIFKCFLNILLHQITNSDPLMSKPMVLWGVIVSFNQLVLGLGFDSEIFLSWTLLTFFFEISQNSIFLYLISVIWFPEKKSWIRFSKISKLCLRTSSYKASCKTYCSDIVQFFEGRMPLKKSWESEWVP